MSITIRLTTNSYNDRRYGKPWIARLDFSADPAGKFVWGNWIGQSGEEGELVLQVNPGDVIARGQKDNRQPKNSAATYSYIDVAGNRNLCDSKIAAIRAARAVISTTTDPVEADHA